MPEPTILNKFNSEMKRIPHPNKVPKDQDKIVLNYRFEEVVGYGAWGKVKRGTDLRDNRPVAIKILRKRRISRKIRDGINKIYSEFHLLTGLDHECVVKYYDLIETNYEEMIGHGGEGEGALSTLSDGMDGTRKFTDTSSTTSATISRDESPPASPSSSLSSYSSAGIKDGKIYLVMEWLGDGCNLTSWIRSTSTTRRNLNCIREILKKLFEAMEYLVKEGIVHHDIKLDNIIYNEQNGSVKVIDFGVAEVCPGDESYSSYGTPAYQAPEILMRSNPCNSISGHKSDMWSIGIVAYQLGNRQGRLPFEGDSVMEVFDRIINNVPDYNLIKDPQLKDLISRLLKKDPKERITAAEALHHPFIKGDGDDGDDYGPKWMRILKSIKRALIS